MVGRTGCVAAGCGMGAFGCRPRFLTVTGGGSLVSSAGVRCALGFPNCIQLFCRPPRFPRAKLSVCLLALFAGSSPAAMSPVQDQTREEELRLSAECRVHLTKEASRY